MLHKQTSEVYFMFLLSRKVNTVIFIMASLLVSPISNKSLKVN